MRNAPRAAFYRIGGASRLAGALAAWALAWQVGAPIHLIASPVMSCCVKAHDTGKCPCRYCTHNRSDLPLLERCGEIGQPDFAVLGLDVFEPAAEAPRIPPAPPELPAAPREQRPPDRPLEVPTPPG